MTLILKMAVESGREPLLHSPYHFRCLTVTQSLPLLILPFSESHYYLSHVILFSLRVLGSDGKISTLCPEEESSQLCVPCQLPDSTPKHKYIAI